MIADDERTFREAVSSLVDWKSLNIEVVALCKNGIEAYDAIVEYHPDIVLADIQMPGMSGLDVVARTKELDIMVEFILLTGHESFEYAHQAISEKVLHYLLKPSSEEEIVNAVKEASASLYVRRKVEQLPPEPGEEVPFTDGYSDYVRKTLKYVEKNYMDADLTLKSISENVLYMNPDYVSRQFMLQTGQRFIEYLSDFRVKKAKWILANGGKTNMATVAEKVGYGNNPKYFTHLFRKATGMAPREYAVKVQKKTLK